MAEFNFEGDVDNITERQLEFINKVILEHGFENSKIVFEPVGQAGDNYVANVKRIKIEGPNGKLTMIAKIAPTLEIIRQSMNTLTLFKNEHLMYTEVLPKLVQLQIDADVPKEEQLRYASCYGSSIEEPYEVILLEDLKESNFTMLDRFSPLSNDCICSVLKNFAVFHSLSFALRHKEPETFSNFKNNLVDFWALLASEESLMGYFRVLEDDSCKILEDTEHAEFIRHKLTDTQPLTAKLANMNVDNKYTVIQQGDSWTNNIMFKFEDEKLVESVMIDYQLSKNTSPVMDIMYMIFNCTDHEARMKNFSEWIDYYHSELEKSLFNFNLKVNLVYPRERLETDLKQYAKLIFNLSILLASVLIRKSEDAAKASDAMKNTNSPDDIAVEFYVSSLDDSSQMRFKNRVIELIESFTQLGLMSNKS